MTNPYANLPPERLNQDPQTGSVWGEVPVTVEPLAWVAASMPQMSPPKGHTRPS